MLKKILTLILAGILLFTFTACNGNNPDKSESNESGNADTSDIDTNDTSDDTESESQEEPIDPSALSDDEYFKDYFKPVIRFVVASDVHIDDEGTEIEEKRLERLFIESYMYADNHDKYTGLDGVFFAGDFVSRGTLSSMQKFFSIVDANVREETVVRVSLGNHEYFEDPTKAVPNLLEVTGYESPDSHLIIGGYHFILLSPNKGGEGYDADKQAWLSAELKIAADDDPTGKRPIFVFNHHPIKNTVYGTKTWGNKDLGDILAKYPQVVDFAGHSHYPINDPRSVWQGTFTALGTGTLSYYEMGMAGRAEAGIFPGSDSQYWQGESHKDAAQFYIVEVDENNAMKIQGYDLFTSSFIMEPLTFRSVGDTSVFKYTDARAENAEIPVFTEDAEIIIDDITTSTATLTFPQAVCSDTVQNYQCFLYKDGKVTSRSYRLSSSFYFPQPETVSLTFKSLKPNTEYTLEVTAISPWVAKSEPLTITFTTPAE